MSDRDDAKAIARRLIELLGGKAKANKVFNSDLDDLNSRWFQDIGGIGTVLRSHLFVEYYLTRYLEFHNPNISDLNKARLSFNQKVALLNPKDVWIYELRDGIEQLNKLRNKVAHSLHAEIIERDTNVFLALKTFSSLRDALASPGIPSVVPLDVLEDFAKHVGMRLKGATSSTSKVWEQAISEGRGVE